MSNNNQVVNHQVVPYLAHESAMVRMERIIRRQWILIIIMIVVLLATNSAWLYYESQMEAVTVEQEAEADGKSTVILNNSGSIDYGSESKTDN